MEKLTKCPECESTEFFLTESALWNANINENGGLDCYNCGNEIDSVVCKKCGHEIPAKIYSDIEINFD